MAYGRCNGFTSGAGLLRTNPLRETMNRMLSISRLLRHPNVSDNLLSITHSSLSVVVDRIDRDVAEGRKKSSFLPTNILVGCPFLKFLCLFLDASSSMIEINQSAFFVNRRFTKKADFFLVYSCKKSCFFSCIFCIKMSFNAPEGSR